jgi:hypothetical protein
MKVTINAEQTMTQIKTLPRNVRKNVIQKAMKKTSRAIIADAKPMTPTESGLLKSSYGHLVKNKRKEGEIWAYIGAKKDKAKYVKVKNELAKKLLHISETKTGVREFHSERRGLQADFKEAKRQAEITSKYASDSPKRQAMIRRRLLRREKQRFIDHLKSKRMKQVAAQAGLQWRNPAHYLHLMELGFQSKMTGRFSGKQMLESALLHNAALWDRETQNAVEQAIEQAAKKSQ